MIPRIKDLFDLDHTIAASLFDGKEYPWDVLADIHDYILALGNTLSQDEYYHPKETVWIAKDATVYPSAYIGEYIIIDKGAQVKHCAFLRENAIVGKNSVIGNSCELKNAVIFDNCEVPHFNYVGDSVLGFHAHMGAGSVTSNVRADRALVVIKDSEEKVETGRKKFGAMLGDWAEIGCNAVLNPGSIIGRHSIVYPTTCSRGIVPENSIRKDNGEIIPRL